MRYERGLLYKALEQCGGHQGKAAKLVGIETSHFGVKLHRDRARYPDPRWNDEPLAWAIRRDGDRVTVGACWTREEIAADVANPTTVAVLRDVGPLDEGSGRARAEKTAQAINTKLAKRVAT